MFKTIRFAAIAATASLIAVPALAQSSPVLGTWATAVDVQGQKIEAEMTFSQAGGAYAVAIKDGPMPGAPADAPPMESKISDVVVDGSKFTFKRALTTPQGAMNLTYTGTVEGDKLTGEVGSDFGPIAITGTRK
ncbi:hypothetical protein KK137_11625 [Croceibacterium sp. LX-88]|uniref:DUF2147 domain-containing protein n=1 Tax=Croceibacterium selenioxidans TaxID=2838833 RepID=A0ABS5W5K6_9SPHN|nr:hypothetical protein [Croceibacterium selenioxidans]MBT2134984.1 hypothetical protein [Croceibacterium selenioxidans]